MKKYRINEACQVTGLSRKTIYRKMEKGLLPYSIEDGKRHINSNDLKSLVKPNKEKPSSKNECVTLREEVTHLRLKIEQLTMAIESLTHQTDTLVVNSHTSAKNQNKPKAKKTLAGDNAKRSEETKQRLFAALDAMEEVPMYRGKPSVTGIHKATGIDRGTVSKYLGEYVLTKS